MKENHTNNGLGKSENLQSSIINHITNHFIFWKDTNSVFLGCNQAFALGAKLSSPEEIIGKTDYDLPWSKEESDAYRADDRQVMESKHEKLNIEETQTLPDGKQLILLTSKVPLFDEEGKVYGVLAIYSDITERKDMEKESEQLRIDKKVLQEQESVTRLLAASMAHELRTPLRAIESGAEGITKLLPLLVESYKAAKAAGVEVPYIAPLQVKALASMAKNTKLETRAAFSVVDMLLVKTSAAHLDTENFKTYSIAHCVKTAIERYPMTDVEAKLIHWQKGDFSFHGDDILMMHIIFNLLKNALHYIKAGNKGEIYISCDKNENFNILHFKDTGQGIDAEILPHIFERFYTRTRHGTGVGLAFCKLVMQSFGGDITCKSVKGEYSDFTLVFPVLI